MQGEHAVCGRAWATSGLVVKGVAVKLVGVKGVILPGEKKTIEEVVEAEKHAEANLIHRREEAATLRSLLNRARLMVDRPAAQ